MVLDRVAAQRLELRRELPSHRHRERRGHADVVKGSVLVIEPEEQGSNERVLSILVPAESGDDAIRGARVLHFDHRALARLVDAELRLDDDPVEARALESRQPLCRGPRIACHRRQVNRRLDPGERALQQRPALGLRRLAQIAAVDGDQIEGDERGRCLLGSDRRRRQSRAGARRRARREARGNSGRADAGRGSG